MMNQKPTTNIDPVPLLTVLAVVLFICPRPVTAQENGQSSIPKSEKHRTGHYQLTVPGFNPRLLNSTVQAIGGGGGKRKKAMRQMVTIVEENGTKYAQIRGQSIQYEIDVPDGYDADTPHGILVYISATKNGRLPGSFREILGEFELIGIGANDSGNDAFILKRHVAAVQAVRVLLQRYNIDKQRIYVSGMSGGGRVCSAVMIMNAPTFSGGFPMCGADPMIPMTYTDSHGNTARHPGEWQNPDKQRLRKAARKNRYVFYTARDDMNRESMKSVADGYKQNNFRYVKYLEDPNAGHEVASTEYVRKAIKFLDKPLNK